MAGGDDEPQVLSGGNVNRVVRIGHTVRRVTGPWSPSVHALLGHLNRQGFGGAPQFVATDEAGREVLTFIPGEVAGDRYPDVPFLWSDDALTGMARLLAVYHDATLGFEAPTAAQWQLVYPDAGQHEVICHNDAALCNVVFRQGVPAALCDFDMAGPGPRWWDLAYAAYSAVPLGRFAHTPRSAMAVPYRAERDASVRAHRIGLFFDAYGMRVPRDLQHWVAERLRVLCATLRNRAAEGHAAFVRMVQDGHASHYEAEAAFTEHHFQDWM